MPETDPRERSWSRFGILVEEILTTLDKGVTTPIQGSRLRYKGVTKMTGNGPRVRSSSRLGILAVSW